MLLLKLIRKLGKVLRGGVAARQIALGAALGVLIGMIPGFGLATVLTILLVLVLNAHVGIALLGFALGKVCCLLLAPITFRIGYVIIHQIGLEGLFRALCSTPVISFLNLQVYSLTGGLPVALIIGVVFGWVMVRSVNGLRGAVSSATESSERLQRISKNKIVRFFMWLVFGKLKGDLSEMMEARPPWIRKAGIILAVVVLALIAGVEFFLSDWLVATGVKKGVAAVNRAEVNLANAQVSLGKGLVELKGLQVTNPSEPTRNSFQSERLAAQLSLSDLLRRRYVMSELAVQNAELGAKREKPGKVYTPAEPEEKVADEKGEGKSLYGYVETAQKMRPYLQKVQKFLKSRKSKDKQKQKESVFELGENRGYLSVSAQDLLVKRPSWMIEELKVDGVSIPMLEGSQHIRGRQLTGQPELLDSPMTINVMPPEGEKTMMSVEFNFHEADSPHQFELNLDDLSLGDNSGLGSEVPVSIKDGRVSIELGGAFTAEEINFPFALKLTGLQADAEEGFLGMDRETASRVLKNVSELTVIGRVGGSFGAPRVSVDRKKTMASIQQSLKKAGKEELSRMAGEKMEEFKEEVSGAVKKELKDKAGEELKDTLKGFGGKKDEKDDGEESEGKELEDDAKEKLRGLF
ncbi:MAG: DUF2062 domain-containing protein [Candidatus Brocadiia bacterium]